VPSAGNSTFESFSAGEREGRETLQIAVELLGELTHAIRTPLGVALNVVSDSTEGVALERDDYRDALSALRSIKEILDSLKPVMSVKSGRAKTVSFVAITTFLSESGVGESTLPTEGSAEVDLEGVGVVLKLLSGRSGELQVNLAESTRPRITFTGALSKLELMVAQLCLEKVGFEFLVRHA
jgi:signal transduction histidine kinase